MESLSSIADRSRVVRVTQKHRGGANRAEDELIGWLVMLANTSDGYDKGKMVFGRMAKMVKPVIEAGGLWRLVGECKDRVEVRMVNGKEISDYKWARIYFWKQIKKWKQSKKQ